MLMKGDKKSFWEIINNADSIVLTTHVRPDGDGIASELALYQILNRFGKSRLYIINQDEIPEMYKWLPYSENIQLLSDLNSDDIKEVELSILLDCSNGERIGKVKEYIKKSNKIISLDHHEDSDCYRDYCYVDADASSIGELIVDIVPDIWDIMTKDIATCLYSSILTDTGSYSYSNTSPKVLKISSELLKTGIRPDYIYRKIYNNKSFKYLKLLGKTLDRLENTEDGKIVYVTMPLPIYKKIGTSEEDNEGILEVIRSLKGVELIILLRQLEENKFKGSLRSEESVNCNYLAKMFGGGGHFKASGFVLEGNINEDGHRVIKKMIDEVRKQGWI